MRRARTQGTLASAIEAYKDVRDQAPGGAKPARPVVPFRRRQPILTEDGKKKIIKYAKVECGLQDEELAYFAQFCETMSRQKRFTGRKFMIYFHDGKQRVNRCISELSTRRYGSKIAWDALTDHLCRNSPIIDATREELAKHMVEAHGFPAATPGDVTKFVQPLVEGGIIERFRKRQGLTVYRLVPQEDRNGRWYVCWKGDKGSHDAHAVQHPHPPELVELPGAA